MIKSHRREQGVVPDDSSDLFPRLRPRPLWLSRKGLKPGCQPHRMVPSRGKAFPLRDRRKPIHGGSTAASLRQVFLRGNALPRLEPRCGIRAGTDEATAPGCATRTKPSGRMLAKECRSQGGDHQAGMDALAAVPEPAFARSASKPTSEPHSPRFLRCAAGLPREKRDRQRRRGNRSELPYSPFACSTVSGRSPRRSSRSSRMRLNRPSSCSGRFS